MHRAVLLTSEIVTNALLHGRAPIQLRLRLTARDAVIEVYDGTAVLRASCARPPTTSTAAGCSSSRRSPAVGHAAAPRRQVRLVHRRARPRGRADRATRALSRPAAGPRVTLS